jgi:MEMO1 family protein
MNTASHSPFRKVRPAAVAGRFYPGHPKELGRTLDSLLSSAGKEAAAANVPKAIIAPHAGYPYSGPIAASAYVSLVPAREVIRRVVLLGPAHFFAFEGLAFPAADAFETPLGSVPVDRKAFASLRSIPQVLELEQAHQGEHSLEVQLPFLQVTLKDFSIVPLVVGRVKPEVVSQVIDMLWDGPETRFVISSDLSHYHNSESARGMDSATARAIETLTFDVIEAEQACGREAVCGLLQSARRRGLVARTLDLRNSGDTAGPRHRVVGYGAFAFGEPRGS